MRIDSHLHCWNRLHGRLGRDLAVVPLGGALLRVGERIVRGMPAELADGLALGERALAVFDAHGIDAGVLVQEYLDGEQNDYALTLMQKYPERFFAYGLPDLFLPAEQAATDCMRLLDRGFRGLKYCGAHLQDGLPLDHAALMPVHERLEREGGFLAADLSEGETQVPALERVLARHPLLRVSVGHFGMSNRGGWPGQLRLARHPNVRIETGGIVWLYRNEGPPFPGALDAILRAQDEVGMEKLMWGSDWPRTMCDFSYAQSYAFLEESPRLDRQERAALLGGNAAAFYGFTVPTSVRNAYPPITAL